MTGINIVVIGSQPIFRANYTSPLLLMYLYLYCLKWRNQLQEGAADPKETSQVLSSLQDPLFNQNSCRLSKSRATVPVLCSVLSYKLFFL
jgi:hypothetical protein